MSAARLFIYLGADGFKDSLLPEQQRGTIIHLISDLYFMFK